VFYFVNIHVENCGLIHMGRWHKELRPDVIDAVIHTGHTLHRCPSKTMNDAAAMVFVCCSHVLRVTLMD